MPFWQGCYRERTGIRAAQHVRAKLVRHAEDTRVNGISFLSFTRMYLLLLPFQILDHFRARLDQRGLK